jgi:hypothetical protein
LARHNLNGKTKENEMGKACRTNGERWNLYRLLVEKPKGKTSLERLGHRLVDSINVKFIGIGWSGMDWINLYQERDKWRALADTAVNLRFSRMLGSS